MAEFGFPANHHRYPLSVRFLQLGVGVNIDDHDIGAEFQAYRPQSRQEFVAEMAPGSAVNSKSRPRVTCHRFP